MRSIRKLEPSLPQIPTLKRVAAYARVSSSKNAMLHSLSAQVSYYSGMIKGGAIGNMSAFMQTRRSPALRRKDRSFSG